MSIRSIFAWPKAIFFAALLVAMLAPCAPAQMKVTDNGYLDTPGFSVILYQNTYSPIFVDEKNAHRHQWGHTPGAHS